MFAQFVTDKKARIFDPRRVHDAEEDEVDRRIMSNRAEIEALILFLPEPAQGRVAEGLELVDDADEIGASSWQTPPHHYHAVRRIMDTVGDEVRSILAAFLQDIPLPERGQFVREYQATLREVLSEREDLYAEEIYEADSARQAWLDAHPEFRES